MAWYSKDSSYPIQHWKFPHRLKDENGKSYTGENAFNNRHKLGWIDVDEPPAVGVNERLRWLGNEWLVEDITNEKIHAQWADIRAGRDNELSQTDWTQEPVSNVVINIIELSSDNEVINELAKRDTITSGSVTGTIYEIPVANSTANIVKVVTPSDIPTGAVTILSVNGTVTFNATADSVTSKAAYGHPGSYIDADVHSQFVTYRQALRDLPATYAANVYAVVFPDFPDYNVT